MAESKELPKPSLAQSYFDPFAGTGLAFAVTAFVLAMLTLSNKPENASDIQFVWVLFAAFLVPGLLLLAFGLRRWLRRRVVQGVVTHTEEVRSYRSSRPTQMVVLSASYTVEGREYIGEFRRRASSRYRALKVGSPVAVHISEDHPERCGAILPMP